MTRMLEHLARNWGNWASVVGLFFSILAFMFSKRASKAAEQARDSVLRRSLTQDMNDANRTASDIVRFVGIERGEMALLRAGELLNETSYFISRWNSKLSEQSRTKSCRPENNSSRFTKCSRGSRLVELTPNQKVAPRSGMSTGKCHSSAKS